MDKNSVVYKADVEYLQDVTDMVNTLLEDAGCDMKTTTCIDISLEEIFVNVAHYAYTYSSLPEDEHTVKVDAEILDEPAGETGKKIRITISDRGLAFDPLKKPDPDITLSADEREIGGLGIFMVKETMDSVGYEYSDGQNIFFMEKYF